MIEKKEQETAGDPERLETTRGRIGEAQRILPVKMAEEETGIGMVEDTAYFSRQMVWNTNSL